MTWQNRLHKANVSVLYTKMDLNSTTLHRDFHAYIGQALAAVGLKNWLPWNKTRGNVGDNVASLTSKQPWCLGISQKEQGTEEEAFSGWNRGPYCHLRWHRWGHKTDICHSIHMWPALCGRTLPQFAWSPLAEKMLLFVTDISFPLPWEKIPAASQCQWEKLKVWQGTLAQLQW